MGGRKQIFISYAHEDREPALRLYENLKQAGHEPWIDEKDLLPGQKWQQAIRSTISDSDYCIILLSRRSVSKRGYVQKEVKLALDILDEFPEDAIFVIPVRIEECCPSHERLQELHWVDFFPTWEDGIQKILRCFEHDEDALLRNRSALVNTFRDCVTRGSSWLLSAKVHWAPTLNSADFRVANACEGLMALGGSENRRLRTINRVVSNLLQWERGGGFPSISFQLNTVHCTGMVLFVLNSLRRGRVLNPLNSKTAPEVTERATDWLLHHHSQNGWGTWGVGNPRLFSTFWALRGLQASNKLSSESMWGL